MGPSDHGDDGVRDAAASRELDAALSALVAVLDEARAVSVDPSRPLAERADRLARAGRSIPPRPVAPRRAAR